MVASTGRGPVVGGEHLQEVDTRPVPKGNPKIGQGPEAKIAITHIPLANGPIPPRIHQECPHRWVSFHMPEGGDTMMERKEPVTSPAMEDLEAWLEYQAGQLGTPPGGLNLRPSRILKILANLPKRFRPPSMCQKFDHRQTLVDSFLHPQPPGTLTEELFIPKDWNIRMSGRDPPF